MFGAGWTEMLIIGIVALVVIGPKDLPIVMRKVGRVVGTVRRMGSEFQRELNKTTGLDQITDLKRSITEPLRQTSEEIAREFNRQTSTGVEPSGLITPTDPKVESVYDQIAATSGVTPAAASGETRPVTVSPAATGAKPVVAKPRRKTAASKTKPAKPAESSQVVPAAAAVETAPEAASKPAKPRSTTPKAAKPTVAKPVRKPAAAAKAAAPAKAAPLEVAAGADTVAAKPTTGAALAANFPTAASPAAIVAPAKAESAAPEPVAPRRKPAAKAAPKTTAKPAAPARPRARKA